LVETQFFTSQEMHPLDIVCLVLPLVGCCICCSLTASRSKRAGKNEYPEMIKFDGLRNPGGSISAFSHRLA